MNRCLRLSVVIRTGFASACLALVLALSAYASDHGAYSEEFHKTYAIASDGRVELDNISGAVHIFSWDRPEVKVDAVKYADSKERLDEARIEIDSEKDRLSIKTRYPHHDLNFTWGMHDNPATVEYTLTVPRTIALDEIKLINGSLDVREVSGQVHAECINGRLEAHDLAGRAELSTINGRLEAMFKQLSPSSVRLSSINGAVEVTIPSDSQADIEASTISGGIDNDWGLHVNHHRFVGHDLRGELGNGGTHIKLEDVNGRIEIRHADDGRALSPVKDLSGHDHERDSDDEDDM